MEKPALSPDFTIEDIHKLREYHYYLTKDMTMQERLDFYNSGAMRVQRKIDALRARDRARVNPDGDYANA